MTGLRTDVHLKADFAWILAGNLVYSGCQWGIVVALAKLGNPGQVGEYALGMAVAAPIVLFANLQLRALVASEPRDKFDFGRYLAFRLVSLGAAMLVVVSAAAATQRDARLEGIVVLVGFAQALECLSDIYYGFMQKHERMDRISVSLLLKGPLSLAALCGAMYATHSVIWAVIALALGRLIVLLAWDVQLGFRVAGNLTAEQRGTDPIRLRWNHDEMLGLLQMALPLGFISMLAALNSSIPRYFLEAHAGSAELGFFSALASLLTAGNLVVSAFGQSIFVPVARACAAVDRAKIRKYVVLTAGLGSGLGCAGILLAALFGRDILTHVFRAEYGERSDVVVRLAIAGTLAFIASGLGYVLTAARSLSLQIPVLVASALAGVATSARLIPKHGLNGAVDAVLAAASVQLAGTLAILGKIDRELLTTERAAPPQPMRSEASRIYQALQREETF